VFRLCWIEKEVAVGVTIWGNVASNNVVLGIDAVRFRGGCARDIDGGVSVLLLHEAVLAPVRVEIETANMAFRIDARDPCKRGPREVDRSELPVTKQEAVEYLVGTKVGSHDATGVDSHCGPGGLGAGDID